MAHAHGNAGSAVVAGPASSSSSQSPYHDHPLNAVAHAQAIPLPRATPSSSGSGGGGPSSASSRPYQLAEAPQAQLPQTYQHGRSVSDASTAYGGQGQSTGAVYPSSPARHQQPTGQTGAYDFNAQSSSSSPQLDIRRQRASLPQSQPGEWPGGGQRDVAMRRSVEGLGLGGIHMPQSMGAFGTPSIGAVRAALGSSPSAASLHRNAIFANSGSTPAAANYSYARQYPEAQPQSYQNSPHMLQHQLALGDSSAGPSPVPDHRRAVQSDGTSSAGPSGLEHSYAMPPSTLLAPIDPSQGPSQQPPTSAPGFYLYQPSRPVQQDQIDPSLGASQTSGLFGPSPVAASGPTFPGYGPMPSATLDAFAYATPPTTANSSTSSPPREQVLPLFRSLSGFFTVQSAYPPSGPTGTPVSVAVSVVAHEPHVVRGFKVVFGRHSTTTRVTSEKRYPDGEVVDLVATTPMLHLASGDPASSSVVGLQLHALDGSGNVVDWADIGQFDYTDASSSVASGSGFRMQKRPGSPLSSTRESPQHPSRATFTDGMSPTHKSVHSRNSSISSLVNGFGHLGHHSRKSSLASAGSDNMAYSHSSSSRPLSSSQRSSLSSASRGEPGNAAFAGAPQSEADLSEGTAERADRKPIARLRVATTSASSTAASSALRHPPIDPNAAPTAALYRSAQITSHPDQGVDLTGLTDQASLQFDSNLDLMAMGWSHDEWVAKRRLVLFTRRQVGQTISANFRPVELGELSENSIVISCIFREDKNECFVTSVDTIYLLEALVAVRFTVEEKNRIRRNLEGFKPITVTKAKAESEDFFKLIMAFPNPKPRNIEKDVKVFPWKTLGPALQKIISKYSASYVPPESITTPGRPVPQPIGWAPGRTPPPSSEAASNDGSTQSTPSSLSAELQDVLHRPGAPSLATVPEHPRSSSSASSHTITPQPVPPALPSSLGAYPSQLPSEATYPFSQEHARYTDGGMQSSAGDNFNPAYRYP